MRLIIIGLLMVQMCMVGTLGTLKYKKIKQFARNSGYLSRRTVLGIAPCEWDFRLLTNLPQRYSH